jgi:hypothetical protein
MFIWYSRILPDFVPQKFDLINGRKLRARAYPADETEYTQRPTVG